MSVESPPTWLQAGSYGAEQTRRGVMFMLQRGASVGSVAGGLVAAGDCTITPPGSGMSINVGTGEVVIAGSSSSTQSGYLGRVSSTSSIPIASADPSQPRIDRVSAVVADAAYAGVTNTFSLAVETGTPTAGASLLNLNGVAAAPASSYTLGYVLVPALSVNVVGGNISNVATQANIGLGLNLATASKGATNIATSQSTSSASYTTLATPDQVTSVVLPTNGLISVWYQATWQESIVSAANATIFLGANQIVGSFAGVAAPVVPVASIGSAAHNVILTTGGGGLYSLNGSSFAGGYTGDVTTGQVVGGGDEIVNGAPNPQYGPCYLFAAAGTYTVSVQFKCSSGSVTASNRKLWVQAISFS